MSNLNAEPIEVQKIKVVGRYGSFSIPETDIKVKYFATSANSEEPGTGEYMLLKELKPMRERVEPSELKDLNSLLQRDLNDARVANELIPYLKGLNSEIAFFPAILGVLMPSGFITNAEGNYPDYEVSESQNGNTLILYENNWDLEIYKIGGKDSKLGVLSINPSNTEIIVLDGQHRSTAFRYVSGIKEDDENDIHSSFYHKIEPSEGFSADLPVTLIWFENESDGINPTLISRNLFVDVNNSAKKVSRSRNILLDDRNITSLLTRFFYSSTAQKASFQTSSYSLLHSGFDIDTDIASKSGNIVTLTNPEIIEYVMSWLFFGSGTYDNLHRYYVYQEKSRKSITEFGRTFNDVAFDENKIHTNQSTDEVVINKIKDLKIFEKEYQSKFDSVIYDIFNQLELFQKHFNACQELEEWVYEQEASVIEVWENAFKGGEGLYYTLNYSKDLDTENKRVKKYIAAAESIENKFSEIRETYFDKWNANKIDRCFVSIRTKAFQVGLFMALKKYARQLGDEKYINCYGSYINRINSIKEEDWIFILTTLRSEIDSSLAPKKWPIFQKVILRFIQENEEYYNADNFRISPEGKIFSKYLINKLHSWVEAENFDITELEFDDIQNIKIKEWSEESFKELNELFSNLSKSELIEPDDLESEGKIIIKKELQD